MKNKDLKKFARLIGTKNLNKPVDFDVFDRRFKSIYRPENNQNRRSELAFEWFNFLKYSDFLHPSTRLSVFFGIPLEEVNKVLGLNSARTLIYRDIQTLDKRLGFDVIEKVVSRPIKTSDFELINSLKTEYNFDENISKNNEDVNVLTKINVDLSKYRLNREFNEEIDDEEFNDFLDILKIFSKPYQMFMKSLIDDEYFGYAKYLLTTDDNRLSELDLHRKGLILLKLRLMSEGDGING